MQLGTLTLASRALLSPLESVSDVGFRSMCAGLGAGITWTEMVRAQSICKRNKSALDLIDTHDPATPTGIQLSAKTPKDLLSSLQFIEASAVNGTRPEYMNIIAVDLNFGCPSPQIIGEGGGPALLKRRTRLRELFEVLISWKEKTILPIGAVGCKIRLGMNQSDVSNKIYLDVADLAAKSSLDYLVVHGRHAGQRSSEPANWEAIREIKSHVLHTTGLKIIGNGDINSVDDAVRVMRESNCDGVMIARGAIKNPWVFRDIKSALECRNGDEYKPQPDVRSHVSIFPTAPEVQIALSNYLHTCQLAGTKEKYVKFHQNNFKRLLNTARLGEGASTIPFEIPRNIHISP